MCRRILSADSRKWPPHNKGRQGFTLIELLLAVGIIAILAVIIGSALDIPLLLVNTRDAERKQQVKTLETAMYQHLVDEWEIASDQSIPEGNEENAKDICFLGKTVEEAALLGCVRLDDLVTKQFIPQLPLDPAETNPNYIGYKVYKTMGRPRIVAAHLGTLSSKTTAPANACGGTVTNPCLAAKIVNGVDGWSSMAGLWNVNVEGNYAYMGSYWDHSFIIADIADPTNPQLKSIVQRNVVGEFQKIENARGSFVVGNTAYVIGMGNDDALTLMDIADKTDPALLSAVWDGDGEFSELDGARHVFVQGDYAYIASEADDTLTIINISTPANPNLVSETKQNAEFDFIEGASDVYVVGTVAYITALHDNALTIVDVSTPTTPTVLSEVRHSVGPYTKLYSPNKIIVKNNYAYITSLDSHSLTIIDVTDPENPVWKSEIWDEGPGGFTKLYWPQDLAVDDTYAYIAAQGDDALTIVDISDPENPTLVSEIVDGVNGFDKLDGAHSVDVQGGYAYVAAYGDSALTIIGVR